jgi:hypothetical protein
VSTWPADPFAAYPKKAKSKNMVKRLLRPTIYHSGLTLVDIEADYTYITDILYLLPHVESICPPLPFCSYLIHNKEALHIIGKLPDLYKEKISIQLRSINQCQRYK